MACTKPRLCLKHVAFLLAMLNTRHARPSASMDHGNAADLKDLVPSPYGNTRVLLETFWLHKLSEAIRKQASQRVNAGH